MPEHHYKLHCRKTIKEIWISIKFNFVFIFIFFQILQNLGKVDRTSDEIFDEYLTNFNRQQQNANRLQKEFNNYIRCIRGK